MTALTFPSQDAWESFFDRITGADAPYYLPNLNRVVMGSARDFYRRVITAFLNVNGSHRRSFVARVQLRRTVAAAMRHPNTYSALGPLLAQHRTIYDNVMHREMARLNELQGIAASAQQEGHSEIPAALEVPDLDLLENMKRALERFSSDPRHSVLLSEQRDAERKLADFRRIQRSGEAAWLEHPLVIERTRAAMTRRRSPSPEGVGEMPPPPKEFTPTAESLVREPLPQPPPAPSTPPPLTAAEEALVDEYLRLVTAVRLARERYESQDPLRVASRDFFTVLDKVFEATGVQQWATELRNAESERGTVGQRNGQTTEQDAWAFCHEYVRAALGLWHYSDVSGEGTQEVFLSVRDRTASQSPMLRLVRNVQYNAGNGRVGELDGVLIDPLERKVVAAFEVKQSPADLGRAREQRNRFLEALRGDTKAASKMSFRVKGIDAAAFEQLVKEDGFPPFSGPLFSDFIATPSPDRWVFISRKDAPEIPPVPSKMTHLVAREIALHLALKSWSVPPMEEGAAHDEIAVASAAVDALDDDSILRITKSIHAQIRRDPSEDFAMNLRKLKEEVWAYRVQAPSPGQFFLPLAIWVP